MTTTPSGGHSTVDVAIVSYNTRDLLHECLTALSSEAQIACVRVADNGSEDGSMEMVHRRHPDVDAISLPDNPGYGAAANALVSRSRADIVVLMNADVRLTTGAIGDLVEHLERHPNVAIAGPRIHSWDGSLQYSCHDDPSVRELLIEETGLHHLRRRWARRGLGAFDHETIRSVPWVLGAALAIRRTAFEEVGGFDAGFFLYYEEVDLCRRLRTRGWEVQFVPTARAVHHGGASTDQTAVLAERHRYRSLRRFHSIHGTARPLSLRLAFGSVIAARLLRDAVAAVSAFDVERRHEGRARVAGWRTVLGDVVCDRRSAPSLEDPRMAHPDRAERHDWLALLPEVGSIPAVVVLGDFTERSRAAIARHFGTRTVADSLPTTSSVDVLVLGAEAPQRVGDALDTLADGGSALIVRNRRRRRQLGWSPHRLASLAADHDLTVLGRYWVLPDTARPLRFVPLDDRAALRWYLTDLIVPSGRVQRAARALLTTVPALAPIVALGHAVVVRRGERRPSALLESQPVVAAGGRADDGLLLVTSGFDAGSRTVAMPFHRGSTHPHMTVKVTTVPELHELTRREHQTLRSLQDELPASLRTSVPTPLALGTWGTHLVSVERFLRGPTLAVELRTTPDLDAQIERLREVAAWVAALHRSTAREETWHEELVQRWLGATFHRYCERFAPSTTVRESFDRAMRSACALSGTALPIVRRHVDVGPWNVVVTADGIGVVDWESGGARPNDGYGLPVCDLEYFVKYWLHIVAEASAAPPPETAVFATLPRIDGVDARAVRTARSTLEAYCDDFAIDRRSIPVLTLYNWAEHAVFGTDRCRSITQSVGNGTARGFVDALARQHQLFANP